MANKAQNKNQSVTNYIAAIAAGCALVVGICGYIANGLVQGILLNGKVIQAKNKANTALDQKIESANKIVSDYNNLGQQKDFISHSLPTSADFPSIVIAMENMSSAAGVKLQAMDDELSIQTGGTQIAGAQGASSPTYTFTTTVKGSYPAIKKFFETLESSARPMRPNSITFKGSNVDIIAAINITTYYQGKADINDTTEVIK